MFATSPNKSNLKMTPETESRFERGRSSCHRAGPEAGAILLRHYQSPFLVEQKVNALGEMEEVTAADREANDLIVERLQRGISDDGILAEESKIRNGDSEKERVWLIDPMDGTKNFPA
jgi:fructose-1,6-bisphosphatase/inositol monophosphatase family enzyme